MLSLISPGIVSETGLNIINIQYELEKLEKDCDRLQFERMKAVHRHHLDAYRYKITLSRYCCNHSWSPGHHRVRYLKDNLYYINNCSAGQSVRKCYNPRS